MCVCVTLSAAPNDMLCFDCAGGIVQTWQNLSTLSLPNLGDFDQRWTEIDHRFGPSWTMLSNLGRDWHTARQISANFDQIWASFVQIWSVSSKFGRIRPMWAVFEQHWPTSVIFWPTLAKCGRPNLADIDQNRTCSANAWPQSARMTRFGHFG